MRSSFPVAVVLLSLVTASWLTAQEPPAAKTTKSAAVQIKAIRGLRIAPSTTASIRRARQATTLDAGDGAAPFHDDGQTRYVMLNLEFDSAASCQAFSLPGHKLITRFDRFADVFVPANVKEEDFQSQKGLVWCETDAFIIPPPARPVPKKEQSRSVPDKIVQGGAFGLTGKGVVLAIVDSGVDFRHPDFITTDTQGNPVSRLLYFWDTTSDAYANEVGTPAPYTYPNGAPIGTIFDRATLTKDIRSGKLKIPVWDPNGHGTACAGVAAGNGSGNPNYKGVAPEADLIAVRIGTGDVRMPTLENSFMLNAICEWLDKVAGDQPLVISCSFGGISGGHDGQSVSERHLSARFAADRRGRAICIAAGNEGEYPYHASASVGASSNPGKITWNVPGTQGLVEIYVQTSDDEDLHLEPVSGTDLGKVSSFVHPLTGHVVISVPAEHGAGGVTLNSKSGKTYVADAYIYGKGDEPPAHFSKASADFAKQVGSPGTALNVLTIGSYDWNDEFHMKGSVHTLPDVSGRPLQVGGRSSYSSPGPLRFGSAVKPEIVAPGQWYSAAAPLNINPYWGRDSTGLYQRHNGTSAATPYTAGIVALLLQAQPKASWGDVRKALIESVTHDQTTGTCPNPEWGYGKLDYAAVERAAKRLKP